MQTTLLCIMDGFGLNPNTQSNAVYSAKKPNLDRLMAQCPTTTLITHGERVGLPEGQMGNSEVGHMNLGAGRVVEQWLLRISRALQGDFLPKSQAYQTFLHASAACQRLHCIGLFSDGGVHSHSEHVIPLLKTLRQDFKGEIILHLFTDGRDTAPTAAHDQIKDLQRNLKNMPKCHIGTIIGRFYGMDRDKRWERSAKAYNALVLGQGERAADPVAWLEHCYHKALTDEFLEPGIFSDSRIGPEDALLFWNFREDRIRQITRALTQANVTELPRPIWISNPKRVLCFTDYDSSFKLPYLWESIDIKNHLGEYISGLGLKQLRVAETEKYPHVTYFFNAGIEAEYTGEKRVLIPSPRDVKTYDLKPEMSAVAVTDVVVNAIKSEEYAFIVVNLANCDMVGHTGVLAAAIEAVETVDLCVGRMIDALQQNQGQALIIADHGNAEQMLDYETGAPHTAHTTYPVPAILFSPTYTKANAFLRQDGALCDVAPTVLQMMGKKIPSEMSGQSLISSKK